MAKHLLALLLACWAFAAAGQDRPISMQDAIVIVQQATGGRVVSASPGNRRTNAGAEPGYWIRVDVRGRIKTVFVDRRGRIHEGAERAVATGALTPS